MKHIIRYIMIATALLFGFTIGVTVHAQTTGEMASKGRPVLAIPIRVVGAQISKVPSSFMHKLAKGEKRQLVEVLDLSVEVSSRALEAFPPSLQPLLYIGGRAYPVQRVEYSNWDMRNERSIDKAAPVGETQTFHFFIEDWRQIERGQPIILSVSSADDIRKATDGQFTLERFDRIMPESKQKIPRYSPQEFMKLGN